jgi:hypothetical protein
MPDLNGLNYVDCARRIANDGWQNWLTAWGFKPLQTKILDIWSEDVRQISEEDARDEGFEHRWQFWQTWCEINDPAALRQKMALFVVGKITDDAKDGIMQAHMKDRPSNKYDSWAIKFKREG